MEKIVALCKRRGFIYPGSDIYGGFANSYTFGPYGVELKKNIKNLWWKMFVQDREDMVGVDGDIILHPRTWEASGHVGGFNDLMIEDVETGHRFRADHLIEEQHEIDVEGWSLEKVNEYLQEKPVKSPTSGEMLTGPVKQFNLMFSTQMNKTTDSEDDDGRAYLRPETAQAIFLEFKNVVDSSRVKVPFGIGQQGKAFRNEITPGNFIFRRLEFEQMEIEYFIAPPPGFNENREKLMEHGVTADDWPEDAKKYVYEVFNMWQKEMKKWCDTIGLSPEKCHDYKHAPEKLSHYSKLTVDIEYDFPFGKKELYGLAYRTDFDISQHQEFSGKKLEYRDPVTNETYIPHVIEPTFGVDRSILAVICDAYEEEEVAEGDVRTVLHLKPCIAPVKVAVFPLQKKLEEDSRKVYEMLKKEGWNVEHDIAGSIGKRYRRQDEIGTPFCVTVDFDTTGTGDSSDEARKDIVTVRERDSMEQHDVHINELVDWLKERL